MSRNEEGQLEKGASGNPLGRPKAEPSLFHFQTDTCARASWGLRRMTENDWAQISLALRSAQSAGMPVRRSCRTGEDSLPLPWRIIYRTTDGGRSSADRFRPASAELFRERNGR
jgi:hypothetical protein